MKDTHFTYADSNYGTIMDILGKPTKIKPVLNCHVMEFRRKGVKVVARVGNAEAVIPMSTPVKVIIEGPVSNAIEFKRLLQA